MVWWKAGGKAIIHVLKVGYHGVPKADLDSVMREGLLRDRTSPTACRYDGHI